jgi:hypothetical protein
MLFGDSFYGEFLSYYITTLAQGREGAVGVGKQRVIYFLLLFIFPLSVFFLLHSWIKIMFQRGRDGFIHIRLCVGAVFGESFCLLLVGSCKRG